MEHKLEHAFRNTVQDNHPPTLSLSVMQDLHLLKSLRLRLFLRMMPKNNFPHSPTKIVEDVTIKNVFLYLVTVVVPFSNWCCIPLQL